MPVCMFVCTFVCLFICNICMSKEMKSKKKTNKKYVSLILDATRRKKAEAICDYYCYEKKIYI